MNRFLVAALALAGTIAFVGPSLAAERTVTLAVRNMYCSACPYIVKQSLARVGGVKSVNVSFADKTATVTYDDAKVKLAALITATGNAGYPSAPKP